MIGGKGVGDGIGRGLRASPWHCMLSKALHLSCRAACRTAPTRPIARDAACHLPSMRGWQCGGVTARVYAFMCPIETSVSVAECIVAI